MSGHCSSVIWFTGLSGAGKSTLAEALIRALRERAVATELLDGDAVRVLSPTGFSRADRDAHVQRVGFLASRLEHHGVTVVCALISPYAGAGEAVRAMCRTFLEIYVSTPIRECERRDPKGLYARARRGEIGSFTGVSDPYEPPATPDLTIDTSDVALDAAVAAVLELWESRTHGSPVVESPAPGR